WLTAGLRLVRLLAWTGLGLILTIILGFILRFAALLRLLLSALVVLSVGLRLSLLFRALAGAVFLLRLPAAFGWLVGLFPLIAVFRFCLLAGLLLVRVGWLLLLRSLLRFSALALALFLRWLLFFFFILFLL